MSPSKVLEFRLIIDTVTPKEIHKCFQDCFQQNNMSYLFWGLLSNDVFFKRKKCRALGKCYQYPFVAPANAAAFEVDPVNSFPE